MAIVVDTSTVIAVAANEPLKPRLVELTRGQELIAVATLPWEIGNAVSAMFKRKRATLEQGLALIAQFQQIPIRLADVPLEESVALAATLNIYAYDAYVIQCARQTGHAVLSLDAGLIDAAHRAGVAVLEVTP
ncbi:MAG: type II toxin-antitoxin system VapC family toxin [Tepidisphaerales bacterium]